MIHHKVWLLITDKLDPYIRCEELTQTYEAHNGG
jgi:hypothetical protein